LLLFVRGNDWASAVAMFAACLSRPDHLALAATMLFAAIVFRRGIGPQAIAFAASAAATAWLSHGSGHPGWWIQLWFSYVEYVPTLEGLDAPFSIVTYVGIIVEVIVRSLTNETWLAITIAEIAAGVMLLWQGWRPDRRTGAVLLALLLTELGKLFVAPQAETRTHIGYTVVGGLLLIEAIVRFAGGRKVPDTSSARPLAG